MCDHHHHVASVTHTHTHKETTRSTTKKNDTIKLKWNEGQNYYYDPEKKENKKKS